MTRPRRRLSATFVTFMVSVVSAAVLGVIIYLASTSIPYFALSPTTDATFGAMNACLLKAMPQRVGFAVDATATEIAAWNGDQLASCRREGTVFTPSVTHIVAAAFDRTGKLWALAGTPTHLLFFRSLVAEDFGPLNAVRMVGTRRGVITLDAQGELRSIEQSGAVAGVAQLSEESLEDLQLSISADGERLAAVWGLGFAIYNAQTLQQLRAEAPCDIESLWWLREGHQALVQCGPGASLYLTLNTDTGETAAASNVKRVRSTLIGPQGPWVEPCDALPCTAVAP